MSEWKWWAAITENNEIVLINPYKRTEPETKSAPSNKWVEVEIRPVEQPPCEWELQTDEWGRTVTAELLSNGRKYCPECGRVL